MSGTKSILQYNCFGFDFDVSSSFHKSRYCLFYVYYIDINYKMNNKGKKETKIVVLSISVQLNCHKVCSIELLSSLTALAAITDL